METATGTIGAPWQECECGGLIYSRYRGSWWRWWRVWYETRCAKCKKVHFLKEIK